MGNNNKRHFSRWYTCMYNNKWRNRSTSK